MSNVKDAIVIGGGIGGLAAAHALAKAGKNVTVLEQAPEFSEIGFGLQLGPNGLRALDELGLLDEVYKHSVFPRRHLFMDAIAGEPLAPIQFGDKFHARYGYPYVVLHRSDLLNVLLEGCLKSGKVETLTNHKVGTVENLGEKVRVVCESGAELFAKMVVGADGIHSKVRKLVCDDSPVLSGYVAYRGTVPMEEMLVSIDWDEKYTWIGPGIHMVQYPIRGKRVINQVAVFESPGFKAGRQDWGTIEELEEAYSQCCPTILHSLKYINRDRNWKLHDREPISNWTVGRVTLLGDSAHAMLQYLAQGGVQALEDAVCLAEKVEAYDDVEKALTEYQNERIPRASQVQRGARMWGEIKHAKDPVTILLRNTIMLNREPDDYEYLDWMYKDYRKALTTK